MKLNNKWIRFQLWVAFLLPRWLVFACASRMLYYYIKERHLTKEQIKSLRYTTVMNLWSGHDGTEGRFKKRPKSNT